MSQTSCRQETHHELIPSQLHKQTEHVDKIRCALKKHVNPFAQKDDSLLCNIIMNKAVPSGLTEEILTADMKKQKLYQDFVHKRLETHSTDLWSMNKRSNLPSFAKPNPKANKTEKSTSEIHLKPERDLLCRFLVITRRSPGNIDEEEIIGNYEFGNFPQSLFKGDKLLSCTDKSEVARELYNTSQNTFRYIVGMLDMMEVETNFDRRL